MARYKICIDGKIRSPLTTTGFDICPVCKGTGHIDKINYANYPKAPYRGAEDWARHAAISDARLIEAEKIGNKLVELFVRILEHPENNQCFHNEAEHLIQEWNSRKGVTHL